MIGGTDIILPVRADIPAADVIFRTVRRHWPGFVYQDADDPAPASGPCGPWLPRVASREFFIYRDEQAARSWDEHGAIPDNANTMLHVLLGDRSGPGPGLGSLTLVCDEPTGEMGEILDEIRTALQDSVESLGAPALCLPLEAA